MKLRIGSLLACISMLALVATVSSNPVLQQQASVDNEALKCEACQAVIDQIDHWVSKIKHVEKRRESNIVGIVENICSTRNFVSYEYSPPKMVESCRALLDLHEEQIEYDFLHRVPIDKIYEKYCLETKICKELWVKSEDKQIEEDAKKSAKITSSNWKAKERDYKKKQEL